MACVETNHKEELQKKRLDAERMLYTTGRSMSNIGKMLRRSVAFVIQVNEERGVRICTDSQHWHFDPDYVPPDPKWRKYVPEED